MCGVMFFCCTVFFLASRKESGVTSDVSAKNLDRGSYQKVICDVLG